MTAPIPYVGVTGFVSQAEVRAAMDAFPACGRKLMVGVLASSKTLAGQTNKYPRRYPHRENIAGIFVDDPRCLNLVHYATDNNDVGLARELVAAVDAGGPLCHGLQVNMAWPALSELVVLRVRRPGLKVVLQLGRAALEGLSTLDMLARLHPYVDAGVITGVLLDASGGRGLPLDAARASIVCRALRSAYPELGIGVAGGLCAETLNSAHRLIGMGCAIDAEGRLRDTADGGGNLVDEKVVAYLAKAAEIVRAKCEHDEGDPLHGGRTGEARCRACGEVFLYCHPCSLAGGADRAIYHAPPMCPGDAA